MIKKNFLPVSIVQLKRNRSPKNGNNSLCFNEITVLPRVSFSARSRVLLNISDHPTLNEAANLPLIIKEKDIEYQLYRIILFDKLLQVPILGDLTLFYDLATLPIPYRIAASKTVPSGLILQQSLFLPILRSPPFTWFPFAHKIFSRSGPLGGPFTSQKHGSPPNVAFCRAFDLLVLMFCWPPIDERLWRSELSAEPAVDRQRGPRGHPAAVPRPRLGRPAKSRSFLSVHLRRHRQGIESFVRQTGDPSKKTKQRDATSVFRPEASASFHPFTFIRLPKPGLSSFPLHRTLGREPTFKNKKGFLFPDRTCHKATQNGIKESYT